MINSKKPSYQMKIAANVIALFCLLSFQACNRDYCDCDAPPMSSTLMGEWEWVKTLTPTQTLTPAQAGYTKSVKFQNDGNEDFLTFHQADSLTLKLVRKRNAITEDKNARIVTMNFFPEGVIRFNLARNEIEFGELMKVYSAKSDTVRHYYRRK